MEDYHLLAVLHCLFNITPTLHTWRPSPPSTYGILVGNYEGKRPYGRTKHRYKDNIKMDLSEICWEELD
jgi:hypothetical protein